MIGALLLLTVAAATGVYAWTLAAKHHLDTRTRHEIAFVLALSTTAVCLGGALLAAVFGGVS